MLCSQACCTARGTPLLQLVRCYKQRLLSAMAASGKLEAATPMCHERGRTSAAAGAVGPLQPAEVWPRPLLSVPRRRIVVPIAAASLPQPPADRASITLLSAATHSPAPQCSGGNAPYTAKPDPSWKPVEPTSWHVRLRRTRCARRSSEQPSSQSVNVMLLLTWETGDLSAILQHGQGGKSPAVCARGSLHFNLAQKQTRMNCCTPVAPL